MRFLTSVASITNIGELRDANSILQFVVGLSKIWDRVFGRDNGESDPTIETSIDWQDLSWPADATQISSASGSLRVQGRVSEYTLEMVSLTDTPTASGIQFSTTGTGTTEQLQLPVVIAKALDGEMRGQVNVAWAPALSFDVNLKGENFNPGVLSPELPGELALSIQASGESTDEQLNARLDKFEVTGQLRDIPLSLAVSASSQGNELSIDEFTLDSGPTHLEAKGTIGENTELVWSLASPDLATLLPDARGSIDGKGRLSGSLPLPVVTANLRGENLLFAGHELASINVSADVDPDAQGDVDVSLDLKSLVGPGFKVSRFSAIGKGKVNQHSITLAGRSDQGDIDLQIDGSYLDPKWTYKLNTAKLAPENFDPWVLVKPATGEIGPDQMGVDPLCFSTRDAQLCAQAVQNNTRLKASYTLENLPMSYIKPLLPPDTRLLGRLSSAGEWVAPTTEHPSGKVNVAIERASVDVTSPEEKRVRVLSLSPSSITATLDQAGVNAGLQIDMGGQGGFDGKIKISGPLESLDKGEVTGEFSGGIEDISFVAALVPALDALRGVITADLSVNGYADKPVIGGKLTLVDSSAALATGLVISDIDAAVTAQSDTLLGIQANARSGEGRLSVTGVTELAGVNPVIDLQIKGTDFQVVDTIEARAAISPDIAVRLDGNNVQFSGEVTVPLLAVTPKKIPPGVVAVSSDQTIVTDKPAEQSATPLNINGALKVILGEEVSIDALGLKASLSGDITVREKSGSETTATGTLNIDNGTFKAYGQNLKIRKGEILYAGGPVSQPGFDIEAVRDITSEVQVGIRARGAIERPQFSLFSTPSMTESEQMSYLVLGRPLEDNSPSENSAVQQAAMALGVAGGKLLTEKFGDKLGVDEIGIDSELRESGEHAALVVGKYLSPKLFVSYGLGLFEPVSTLRLNYSISQRVKIVSETTESRSGGDIVFTFEGGK